MGLKVQESCSISTLTIWLAALSQQQLQIASPIDAPDEQLSRLPDDVHLFASELDPLLDDSVGFCRRLRALGKSVTFELFGEMPHGCLRCVRSTVMLRLC